MAVAPLARPPEPAAAARAPASAVGLVWRMRRDVLPAVDGLVAGWVRRAGAIADPSLRAVALESLASRGVHARGLAAYALLAEPAARPAVLAFVVAFQTLTDYVDGRCDAHGAGPAAAARLHRTLLEAAGAAGGGAVDAGDGGYLAALVAASRAALRRLPGHAAHAPDMARLARRYVASQVLKGRATEPALRAWAAREAGGFGLAWYEFAAAANSTLTLHCLAALAGRADAGWATARRVVRAYFPHVQMLGVLLDNLVDQAEDAAAGHLNFCVYHRSDDALLARLAASLDAARAAVATLPDAAFHRLVIDGHLALYRWGDHAAAAPGVRRMLDALAARGSLAPRVLSWLGRHVRRRRARTRGTR